MYTLFKYTFKRCSILDPEAGISECAIRQEGHKHNVPAGCDIPRSTTATERTYQWCSVVTSVVDVDFVVFAVTGSLESESKEVQPHLLETKINV